MPLPDCMMPDGADPCRGYQALRQAAEKALGILERNLWHQREKCDDAVAILRRAIQEN